LKPCISQATTMSSPFEADIKAYVRGGWKAVELWLTKLETHLEGRPVAEVRAFLESEGITPAAAAGQGGHLLARGEEKATHRDHFRRRLDILQALGVPNLVVVADFFRTLAPEDFGGITQSLGELAELAGQAGVRLCLEFQKGASFCASLDTAAALVAQVGSPHLAINFDAFHYYTGPSKYEDLAYLSPENLGWVQLSDLSSVPRELAGDADRIFPGEGDFQLDPILDHFAAIGYEGYVSLEVLNPSLWSIPADRVADMGYQAMVRTLGARNSIPAWGGA
jgi:2-keto-myo-inositol isomerase